MKSTSYDKGNLNVGRRENKKTKKPNHFHAGHRERMIEKFSHSENLPEHELIEILLFRIIPRKNTNNIAHALLQKFGSAQEVFRASIEDLMQVEGVGRTTAEFLSVTGMYLTRSHCNARMVSSYTPIDKFRSYLRDRFCNINREYLDAYFLDAQNQILFVKTFLVSHETRSLIDFEEFTKTVTSSHAKSIVVANNHPKFSCRPTPDDDYFTRQCLILCSITNLKFIEHFVVGYDGVFSYNKSIRLFVTHEIYSIERLLEQEKREKEMKRSAEFSNAEIVKTTDDEVKVAPQNQD